ncbi:MAG: beta-galactosidase trimerization domain-containing protein [Eubacteriales bacterium]|nr:beta-galactosidase trimerization domain-containing protein [Eubacteriales bacterium]
MAEKEIPFRQIHLDFHTSEDIEGICGEFDAQEFAQTLEDAHVNSVTLFSCGHHGNLYYDSKLFPEMVHPHLVHRDLLEQQSAALRERGIQVNLYTTIRWNKRAADLHPEWICIDEKGTLQDYKGKGYFEAGFYKNLCVNTPYRDFLKKQFGEVLENIPGDGVWYDAAFMNECCCPSCQRLMREQGLNPAVKEDRQAFARWTYYDMVRDLTEFAKSYNPDFHVCYNKGHVGYLDKPVKDGYSYFSFESLPGVEWGYLDFPVSAKYMRNFGKECLGLTSRFHTEWGDFHAFRNEAAMEYEVFSMLAQGCKCTIGDQMDYWGKLNQDMYKQIGRIYGSVEAKEPWCEGAVPIAEIGVFTAEEFFATGAAGDIPGASEGAARLLTELGYQFDFIDSTLDFGKYRLLILPDVIPVDEELAEKLSQYIEQGGKLLASYCSGLDRKREKCMLPDLGITYLGEAPYSPDFISPKGHLAEGMADGEHVMYDRGTLVKAGEDVTFIQNVIPPVFNRSYEHFCSHLHSPSGRKEEYPGIVETERTAYFIHPVFTTYQNWAPKWYKSLLENELARLLPGQMVRHDGPSTVQQNLLYQEEEDRMVLHTLHYVPVKKCKNLEIVEDVIPLYNLMSTVEVPKTVKEIYSVPEKMPIPFQQDGNKVSFIIQKVNGHHMTAICFKHEDQRKKEDLKHEKE